MVVPISKTLDNLRVLIVDDNKDLAEFYSDLLSLNGCVTSVFNNGIDALTDFKFKINNYDLILSDISMPGMTGDELAVEVLKLKPDMPIILCSGFHPDLSTDDLMKLGIKHFLPKPIDSTKLLDIINELKLC
ncbi:MAG: hypothetical protein DIZ80_15125 [endosymbiont of Galathealinum brachiosum]|uniref:Response regulatory domain-containing protein n=1 Tax=endosymbiont of Galathealinum brachiosum TaxID=2200906 RepID=A0A370DAU4_9GAMM|nr:MAG: hypothetical protein DIZ80_15125 [endosymbiont of Galathealinum brachiosum]